MKFYLTLLVVFFPVLGNISHAQELKFSLHKHSSNQQGPTLLVIGGIQGDEPGGFTAASMLVTNYNIRKGNLWIVPNLNFESIIKRSRGVYGDMNRKFKTLSKQDPEYEDVQKIKKIILDEQVDIVLNLHDGSGFYNKKYIDKWNNPHRWGQSIIVDQESVAINKYGQLSKIAAAVSQYVNKHSGQQHGQFGVKNTETRKGNVEMEKTLTYFAISNKRSAFGVESSKQFRTYERAYYHLLAVEGFMSEMGIQFERNFKLTRNQVKSQIGSNLNISLYDSRVRLKVDNARKQLNFVPMKKRSKLEYEKTNPLLAVVGDKGSYRVRYGNRSVTRIRPQYFEYDEMLKSVAIQVDGKPQQVNIGHEINVKKTFKVLASNDYRVNVIGFKKAGINNENRILINRKNILSRFSIDKGKNIYRVEIYRGKKFGGMFMVNFSSPSDDKNYSSVDNSKDRLAM